VVNYREEFRDRDQDLAAAMTSAGPMAPAAFNGVFAGGNQMLGRMLGARQLSVQRCGDHVSPGCACAEDEEIEIQRMPGTLPVQRTADALPWLWDTAATGARAVGAGLGAVAAGIVAGAAVLFTPSTSIMSGSEEAWRLGHARGMAAVRAIAQAIAEITAMAVLTAQDVEKYKGRVSGAIAALEEFLRGAARAAMRCSTQMLAFRQIAQRLLDYLNQPLDQINKVELTRLMEEFEKAMQALLDCMGAVPPSDGGDQAG
jgi:hypothetical protein